MSAQTTNTKQLIQDNANTAISEAFQKYIESGGRGVCEFRDSFISVINDHMASQKGLLAQNKSSGAQWRQDIKNHFSGRGRKWIAVPLEIGLEALTDFVGEGDVAAIKTAEDFARQGFAWVRFYAPTGDAAFPQVRCDLWHHGSSVVTSDIRVNLPWEDVQTYEILSDTPRRLGFENKPEVKAEAVIPADAPSEEELDKTTTITSIDALDLDETFADLVNDNS